MAIHPDTPITNFDTSFYQHAGWYINQGAIPYAHIWDVKPPLHFEFQALLSFLTFGNITLLHWMNIILSNLALIATVYFTFEIVQKLTKYKYAAWGAALTLLCYPTLYIRASMGFRNKIYVLCFGAAALLLQLNKRSFWAGVFSTLSLGFWQFGIIFPIMVISKAFSFRSFQHLRRTLMGILISGVLVLLPVFYWGVMEEMIVEAILVPIIMSESLVLPARLIKMTIWANYAFGIYLAGIIGLGLAMYQKWRQWFWLFLGTVTVVVQVLVDLDGPTDAFLLCFFLSIGVGYLFKKIPKRFTTFCLIFLFVVLIVNGVDELIYFENEKFSAPTERRQAQNISGGNATADSQPKKWSPDDYWSKKRPNGCHYRRSQDETKWMNLTKQSPTRKLCGQFSVVKKYFKNRN